MEVDKIMKRYTLRAAIHDARIFKQLRREYHWSKENLRKHSPSGWVSISVTAMRHFTAVLLPWRHRHSTG
jgi:hypothetical protein